MFSKIDKLPKDSNGGRSLESIWHVLLPYTGFQKNALDYIGRICDFRGDFSDWVAVPMDHCARSRGFSYSTMSRAFSSLVRDGYLESRAQKSGIFNKPTLYRFTRKFWDAYEEAKTKMLEMRTVSQTARTVCQTECEESPTVPQTEHEQSVRPSTNGPTDRASSYSSPKDILEDNTFGTGTPSGAKDLEGVLRSIMKANRIPYRKGGDFDATVSDGDIKATAQQVWSIFGVEVLPHLKAIRQDCVEKPGLRIRDEVSLERIIRQKIEASRIPPQATEETPSHTELPPEPEKPIQAKIEAPAPFSRQAVMLDPAVREIREKFKPAVIQKQAVRPEPKPDVCDEVLEKFLSALPEILGPTKSRLLKEQQLRMTPEAFREYVKPLYFNDEHKVAFEKLVIDEKRNAG